MVLQLPKSCHWHRRQEKNEVKLVARQCSWEISLANYLSACIMKDSCNLFLGKIILSVTPSLFAASVDIHGPLSLSLQKCCHAPPTPLCSAAADTCSPKCCCSFYMLFFSKETVASCPNNSEDVRSRVTPPGEMRLHWVPGEDKQTFASL